MKKSTNNIIIEFLGLIIGCMFMGVGLNMFFKPYTIAPGGLSGLSLVISKFTGLICINYNASYRYSSFSIFYKNTR